MQRPLTVHDLPPLASFACLEDAITHAARALGFHAVGMVSVEDLKTHPHWQLAQANYHAWISQKYQAGMDWMTRYTALRLEPWQLLPGTQSIVCVAISYRSKPIRPHTSPHHGFQVAQYAQGKDYHRVIRKRLQRLLNLIQAWIPEHEGQATQGRPLTDSAPALEKPLAQLAGLGWQGKNTLLIHPTLGSTIFLGELLLTLPLRSSTPFTTHHCGTCTRCLEACPTQAFPQPGVLDSNRCIAYWTIETDAQTLFPNAIAQQLNGWVFGCDICQQVCPFNQKAPSLTISGQSHLIKADTAFEPRPWIQSPDTHQWQQLSQAQFNQWFQANPIQRTGLEGLQRNMTLALQAIKPS
ncbi:MAG: tRNA epoxyqueuosine(34) reductase QueG [Vampirovibrionales bacterium]